jgi:hypothetical protein
MASDDSNSASGSVNTAADPLETAKWYVPRPIVMRCGQAGSSGALSPNLRLFLINCGLFWMDGRGILGLVIFQRRLAFAKPCNNRPIVGVCEKGKWFSFVFLDWF